MRLHRWMLPLLSSLVFFGVIGAAQATGQWTASGRTAEVSASVATPGSLAPADIKGWMTVRAVADGVGMPVADLVALIGGADGAVTGDTVLKDIEPLVEGFTVTDLREKVAAALAGK